MQSDSLQRIKTCSVLLDPYLDVCACIMMTLLPKLKPGIFNELANNMSEFSETAFTLLVGHSFKSRPSNPHPHYQFQGLSRRPRSVPKDLWIMTASPCLLRHYLGCSKERLSYVQQ